MQAIPLPNKIQLVEQDGNRYVFVMDPLFTGYGDTIGNALRRVLLSSMPGAAVTAVKIKWVDHEFSNVPNIKEDVIQIPQPQAAAPEKSTPKSRKSRCACP